MLLSRSSFATLTALALSGCLPPAHTGSSDADAIIELVAAREAPLHNCIEVTSPSTLVADYPPDYPLPNGGGWDVRQFTDPRVVDAARRIAVPYEEAVQLEHEHRVLHRFGTPTASEQRCSLSLSYPIFSEDFAFLHFVNPDWHFGSYALERRNSRWTIKQRVHHGVH
jgi:hypothetical protein